MRTGFRTKVFIGSVAAATVSLIVAAVLLSVQVRDRQRDAIERRLVNGARLIAELLPPSAADRAALDAEADRVGDFISSRVTLIAGDGRVVGDSTQTLQELDTLENHAARPEVIDARERGLGISRRYSTTVGTDMLYVAARSDHPTVRYVRLALPLTEIAAELATVRRLMLIALGVAVPVAMLLSWVLSAPLTRRVREIAAVARKYSTGDLSRPAYDYGQDELGAVARVLDASVQELAGRLQELARDRARMEAILTGMGEGVLVLDRGGRIQLVNDAARRMLRVDEATIGRPYLAVIRHPSVAAPLTAALRGEEAEAQDVVLPRDPERIFVARAAPVAAAGGGGAVLVMHDITELRRADRIRRDFVANVSHELRTPLTAIRGYL